MKNIILVIAILFISSIFANSEEIHFTYSIKNPHVYSKDDSYQMIGFDGAYQSAVAGAPLLPYKSVALLLPQGHEAIEISINKKDPISIQLQQRLFPKQHARPLSKPDNQFIINNTYYNQKTYPNTSVGSFSTQYYYGHSVLLTTFTPVVYYPMDNKADFFQEVEITVKTRAIKTGSQNIKNLKTSPKIEQQIKTLIDNEEALQEYSYSAQKNDTYQYLIITPSQFVNTIASLKDLHNSRGLNTKIETTENISAGQSGIDLQEKIRNYIIQEYQNHDIEYVLLGGDVEHIPYRGFYCSVQSSTLYESSDIPSDLYYSAIDGSWNDDGDNNWGEIGEDDLLPEIAVGRMSFSNSSELTNMLNKTISYLNNPVFGELRDPLLAGEDLWSNPQTWGGDYLDLLVGNQNQNGYITTGIPTDHNVDTLFDRELPSSWTPSTLIGKINTGKSFIHHSGHANSNYAMRLYNSDITNANFSQVDGIMHNFPLIYTHGCICGAFDDSDCIAEYMVKIEKFAVGFVGNSRYGWFNEGQTEGPSAHIHREFVDALYDKHHQKIAKTHMISKVETAPFVNAPGQHEEGALRWCFYDCNVLADAALDIWTDEPENFSVNYNNTIPVGTASIDISVSKTSGAVENFSCVFYQDSVVKGMAQTDSLGNATITFYSPIDTPGNATLTVCGKNSFPQHLPVTIIPTTGAFVLLDEFSVVDENNQADYNDEFSLEIVAINMGTIDASGVSATISTNDPYLIISDSIFELGNINAGDTITAHEVFQIETASFIPDQHLALIEVVFEDDSKTTWNSNFQLLLNAPDLALTFENADVNSFPVFTSVPPTETAIDDNYTYNISVEMPDGNLNAIPDPGETIILQYRLKNTGHSKIENLFSFIESQDDNITIINDSLFVDLLLPNADKDLNFLVKVKENANIGEVFTLNLTTLSDPYDATLNFTLNIGLVIEDWESGDFNTYNWQHSGEQDWTITSSDVYEGSYAAKSGIVGHNEASELSINVNVLANDTISFYRKVSSEANYDFFEFYIDGQIIDQWAGEVPWAIVKYPVTAGNHSFKWRYMKDVMVSSGSDCAWLDYIEFPPFSSKGNINLKKNIIISGESIPEWLTLSDHGDGTATLSGTPGISHIGHNPISLMAESGNDSHNQEFDILVFDPMSMDTKTEVSGLSLFPNPTNGILYIDIKTSSEKIHFIQFFDLQGRLLSERTNLASNELIKVDVSSLQSGVYFIKVITADQILHAKCIKK